MYVNWQVDKRMINNNIGVWYESKESYSDCCNKEKMFRIKWNKSNKTTLKMDLCEITNW